MAAPLMIMSRNCFIRASSVNSNFVINCIKPKMHQRPELVGFLQPRLTTVGNNSSRSHSALGGKAQSKGRWVGVAIGVSIMATGVSVAVIGYFNIQRGHARHQSTSVIPKVDAADFNLKPTDVKFVKTSRQVHSLADNSGLKLTLYQYQTCPFCCKVRAYLDYHSFSYSVVEVNSVWRTEIKWSKYKKVPILVTATQNDETLLQLNDSSLIVSALESFLVDRSVSLPELLTYYPEMEVTNTRGKTVYEHPNKYFVMYGDRVKVPPYRDEERKWRQWADDVLVHTISPNIYRTPTESLQAFHYFSDAGSWNETFGFFQRNTVIYVGATAMFFIGKMLKKRYKLHDDVRQSLYDACEDWVSAVGAKRQFMGGDKPNLADLAVYGVLNSMEGCVTFQDLSRQNADIIRWYHATKNAIAANAGSLV